MKKLLIALVAVILSALLAGAAFGVYVLFRSGPPSSAKLVQTLATEPDQNKQQKAARTLAKRLEPVYVASLERLARSSERAQTGLELLRNELISIFDAASADANTRIRVLSCLVRVDDRPAADKVTAAIVSDPTPHVRDMAVKFLARMKRSKAQEVATLIKALDGDPAKKQALRLNTALVEIGAPAVPELLARVRVSSAVSAGTDITLIGAPAIPVLKWKLRHAGFWTQVDVGDVLVEMDNDGAPSLSALVRPLFPQIARGMVQQLGTPHQGDATLMLEELGRPAAAALLPLARNQNGRVHKQAEEALVELAAYDADAVTPIVSSLRRGNYELGADLYRFFIRIGRGGTEAALAQSLYRYGDTTMALAYLNCGNAALDSAGRTWASNHGYVVVSGGGSAGGPSWGSN